MLVVNVEDFALDVTIREPVGSVVIIEFCTLRFFGLLGALHVG